MRSPMAGLRQPESMYSRREPLPEDNPLAALPNVVLTPHIGSATLHHARTDGGYGRG
jgi:hypothetical protein